MKSLVDALVCQIQEAGKLDVPLRIVGCDTKSFLGREGLGEKIDISGYSGIVNYEPTELVVKVKAGTPLESLQDTLATSGQALAFEPPHFGVGATVGGTVAAGLSGPSRPYQGSIRDFVLGITCINGRGELLRFGGQVMKNVAGYDISRLMTGAMGTLGLILDVSFKVLPLPETQQTLVFELSEAIAIATMNEWAARPIPLSGGCYYRQQLRVRLSGRIAAVESAIKQLGGTVDPTGDAFWRALREHQLPFFHQTGNLWRIMVSPTIPSISVLGDTLIDWGGAQRWVISSEADDVMRKAVNCVGGYATRYRGGNRLGQVFHPLDCNLANLQSRLKTAFDPFGILNPGRLYAEN